MSSEANSVENNKLERFDSRSETDLSLSPEAKVQYEDPEQAVRDLAQSMGINESKLTWKIDLCVVPAFCLLYFLLFLDRINISNAKVYGMATDLNLVGNQFNTALTIFYVPYVFFEVFSNYCMKLLKPHVWLSVCILLFGVVTIGLGFVTNYGGLVLCRFLLGVFESGSFPAIFYVLSNYYTRVELQRRFSTFFSVVCLAGACGGAIAYKIGVDLDGVHGIASWQYIFIIEGAFTLGLLFVLFFLIPDFPEEAKFLNENERAFLKKKLEIMSGTESGYEYSYNFKDIMNVLKSPAVWLPTLGYFGLIVPAYGYAYFATSIIQVMGYTGMELNRRSIYPWLVAFGYSNIIGFISDRFRKRLPFAVSSALLAIIGLAMVLGTGDGNIQVRYLGCFLSATGLYTLMPVLVCWASLNFGGHSRKGVGSAAMIGCGNVGGIISTWIFLAVDAPLYKKGLAICILFTVLSIGAMFGYYIWCKKMNSKKQATSYHEKFFSQTEEAQIKDGDLHPSFVYGY